MMSTLIENILKISLNDVRALGWNTSAGEKAARVYVSLPLEHLGFKDIVDSCVILDTMRTELEELGYTDDEIVGNDTFLRIQLRNSVQSFSLFVNKEGDKLYSFNATLTMRSEGMIEDFFDNYSDDYYRLLLYFSCKFQVLRHILLGKRPTYIARREDETGKWVHMLRMQDSMYISKSVDCVFRVAHVFAKSVD